MTDAMKAAVRWMREHGGDCAVARVKGGGRIFLAQGERAPFMPWTAKALVDAGLAEYVDINGRKSVRFRLTGRVTAAESEANARLIAAAPDFAEVAPGAADLLEQYAAFIRTVKADDLELHPYLPEVERVVEHLRAAIAKTTGAQ